mgnify:CR=1 FL=1
MFKYDLYQKVKFNYNYQLTLIDPRWRSGTIQSRSYLDGVGYEEGRVFYTVRVSHCDTEGFYEDVLDGWNGGGDV